MKEYKEFKGEFKRHAHQIIEDLRNEGYFLQSIKDLMENRVNYCGAEEYPLIVYVGSDSKDAIAYNSKSDAKIILDAEKIIGMNNQTKFKHPNTSLPVTDGEWEEWSGEKVLLIPKKEISSLNNKGYRSKEEILGSKEWNFLARDPKILSNYFDFTVPLMAKDGIDLKRHRVFSFSGIGFERVNSLDTLSLMTAMYFSGIAEKDLFNGTNTFIGVR